MSFLTGPYGGYVTFAPGLESSANDVSLLKEYLCPITMFMRDFESDTTNGLPDKCYD